MRRLTLVTLLATASAAACDHSRFEATSSEEIRYEVDAPPQIEIRVDRGRIDVTRGSTGTVELVVHKIARASDRAGAESLLERVIVDGRQDGNVILVRAESGTSERGHFGGTRADIELKVPEELLSLDVRSGDGRVSLTGISGTGISGTGISGTIRAETDDGSIRVSDVHGQVRLRTNDGSIAGTDISGDFDVATDDGRIQLDGPLATVRAVTADGTIRITCEGACPIANDWTIRSLDGSIELTVPETTSARIDASTTDGRVVNRWTRLDGTERGSRVQGTLGGGGPLILVTTMDGRVTLK